MNTDIAEDLDAPQLPTLSPAPSGSTVAGRSFPCPQCGAPRAAPFFRSLKCGYCLVCARKRASRWRRANKVREKELTLEYRTRNKDTLREKQREIRAANPEKLRQMRAARYAKDPEKYRLYVAFRSSRIRGLPGREYTTAALVKGRAFVWGLKCWCCGGPYQAIDHVKPVAKGGSHWPSNLRPICSSCNARKKDRWPLSKEDILGIARRTANDRKIRAEPALLHGPGE